MRIKHSKADCTVNNTFYQDLKSALANPLPGTAAQLNMAPGGRSEKYMTPSGTYKKASVHLTIFEKNSEPHLLFIKRASIIKEDKHSGQISFPGGQLEDSDLTLEDCALRETNEELGLDISKIKRLGPITPIYVYVSNFMVYPFVGIYQGVPKYTLQKSEVDYVIEAPICDFLSDSIIKTKDIPIRDMILSDVPYYDLQGETLWGATAMMTSEFISILKSIA